MARNQTANDNIVGTGDQPLLRNPAATPLIDM